MYEEFLASHKIQLIAGGIPEHFWYVLFNKLLQDNLDASNVVEMLMINYDNDIKNPEDPEWIIQVSNEKGLEKDDPDNIYLIDHAWTFRLNTRKQQLMQSPSLRSRMCQLMAIDKNVDDAPQAICDEMWKYCQNYTLNSVNMKVEDCMPVWYIMDELGTRIQHSDTPNVRIVPFLFIPKRMTYSVMFPIKNIAKGECLMRDFAEGTSKELIRKAALLPWFHHDFRKESFVQDEPGVEYFLSGRIDETLPKYNTSPKNESNPLKVYTQYKYVQEYLTNSHFILCEDESSADILWYMEHFKSYEELSVTKPNTYVNQFPFENILTTKDLLSIVCRRRNLMHHDEKSLETYPKWLPTTYNLHTELVKFVSYFQNRTQKGLDNTWICKPWNLARGLDTHITNNLNGILRICNSGPKIVQKYIQNPVLFNRPNLQGPVKFDIRYIVLLKSIQPLDAYIYKNFFLRFANKPFELGNFEDYEKHFTVMNYKENVTLYHLKCADFKIEWEKQYPHHRYCDVESDIKAMLSEMLQCALIKEAPLGISNSPQSRALYAVDLMLKWSDGYMQPTLLEVNWMPDCKRACEYYPEFYNDIFKLLFTHEADTTCFEKL